MNAQREHIIAEMNEIKQKVNTIKNYCDFFNSDAGKKQVELFLLIDLLVEMTEQKARADGWTLINVAAAI